MTGQPPGISEEAAKEERRQRNVATLRTYFQLLEQKDIDAWIALWAKRCVIVAPYAAGPVPPLVTGREDVYAFYRDQAARYARLSFPGTRLMPMENADRVLVQWYPHGELINGPSYRNENLGIFEFDETGKIRYFTEYFDPSALSGPPQPA